MSMVALLSCAVDFAPGVVLGDGALDDAGADPQPSGRHESRPGRGGRSGRRGRRGCTAMTPAARVTWSRAAFRAMVNTGPVGVGARDGRGGVGDGCAQCLVGDEQGVDLLLERRRGCRPQDAAAEDGRLQLEVGGLDLPALMVENGQVGGGVAGRVGQGGDSPGTRWMVLPALVVTVQAASMTRTVTPPRRDSRGPVGQALQDGERGGAVPGLDADQEVRLRRGNLPGQGPAAEVPVGEQQHPCAQAAGQVRGRKWSRRPTSGRTRRR